MIKHILEKENIEFIHDKKYVVMVLVIDLILDL